MNTLQKDLDAMNWAILGPKLLNCVKQNQAVLEMFCAHETDQTSPTDLANATNAMIDANLGLIAEAEALNV